MAQLRAALFDAKLGVERIRSATLPYHAPLCPASYPSGLRFGKRCLARQRDWCLLAWPPAAASNGSLF